VLTQIMLCLAEAVVIYVIKTVMKYYLKKIDASFHQRFPNMVQRLFADVIHDAIWFMNIHEQNHCRQCWCSRSYCCSSS
jgi:hypothetical protein